MYRNLDMPVKWFHKIIETNSLEYLFTRKPKGKYVRKIRKASGPYFWEKINDQLITEFGVPDDFKTLFYKQRDIINLEIQSLLGDTSADFFIQVAKSDLERIKSRLNHVTNYKKYHAELHRAIQVKWPGRNTHELTVFEFYNDVNDLMKESEQRELELIRNGTDG